MQIPLVAVCVTLLSGYCRQTTSGDYGHWMDIDTALGGFVLDEVWELGRRNDEKVMRGLYPTLVASPNDIQYSEKLRKHFGSGSAISNGTYNLKFGF